MYRQRGRAHDVAGHTTRPGAQCGRVVHPRRAPARFLQSWSRGFSTMSHVIPLRLFQTLKSSCWNCNVCGLCRKVTVLNYVRLLGGGPRKGSAHRQRGRACDTAGHTMRTRRAPVRFLQSWSRSFSTMSHVIPLRLFQTLKSSRWNCNVCGLCRKMTVLNYVRLLGGGPRKGGAQTTQPGARRGRADNEAGRATLPGTRRGRARARPRWQDQKSQSSSSVSTTSPIT